MYLNFAPFQWFIVDRMPVMVRVSSMNYFVPIVSSESEIEWEWKKNVCAYRLYGFYRNIFHLQHGSIFEHLHLLLITSPCPLFFDKLLNLQIFASQFWLHGFSANYIWFFCIFSSDSRLVFLISSSLFPLN